jgi:hsp70-interacting protein
MSGEGAQFAWLGLLKWSLNYTDGTNQGESPVPMSPEDRAFLTKVMEEGIVNESTRMREVLKNITAYLENPQGGEGGGSSSGAASSSEDGVMIAAATELSKEDELLENLNELQFIVEQIDFARAFCQMNGLPFLLGLASELSIASNLRHSAVGILATLTQNNPPVQIAFCGESVEGLEKLATLFASSSDDAKMQKKILQAMSCAVRAQADLEESFVNSAACRAVLQASVTSTGNSQLQAKGVFTLRTLVTSDTATPATVEKFSDILFPSILSFVTHTTEGHDGNDVTVREESLRVLGALSASVLAPYAGDVTVAAKERATVIAAIADAEEKSWCDEEIELWTTLIAALSKKEEEAASNGVAASEAEAPAAIPMMLM